MTLPFDRLSDKDKTAFINYIKDYGPGCDDEDYIVEMSKSMDSIASPSYLLRFWNLNKNRFLAKAFGDNLIIKVPIEYSTPRAEKEDDIWQLCSTALFKAIKDRSYNLKEYFWDKPNIPLDEDEYINYYNVAGQLVNPREMFDTGYSRTNHNYIYEFICDSSAIWDNLYTGETFSILIKDKPKLKIPHGIKWIRGFTKIAEYLDYDADEIEQFRLQHSMCINTKLLKGNLCLSIHPMDYITMSDATFSSCMNWQNVGAYRRGTVEMMNSDYIVVVYLESEHDRLNFGNDDSWNLKKWRTLLIVSPEHITSVKSYPYQCNELTVIAINEMQKLVEQAYPEISYNQPIAEFEASDYCWDPQTHEPVDRYETPDADYNMLGYMCGGAMYCDMGATTHFILASNLFDYSSNHSIDYSGESECMFCGEVGDTNDFPNSSAVFCFECQGATDDQHCSCCECGININIDDAIWDAGVDDYLCPNCYDKIGARCICCGETILRADSNPLIISYNGMSNKTKWNLKEMQASTEPTWYIENGAICNACGSAIEEIHDKSEEELNEFLHQGYDGHWRRMVYNFLDRNSEPRVEIIKQDDIRGILVPAENEALMNNCGLYGIHGIINTIDYQQYWNTDETKLTRNEIRSMVESNYTKTVESKVADLIF